MKRGGLCDRQLGEVVRPPPFAVFRYAARRRRSSQFILLHKLVGIGEERRVASGVDEDHGIAWLQPLRADVVYEPRHRLRGIDRIEEYALILRDQPKRLAARRRDQPVALADI